MPKKFIDASNIRDLADGNLGKIIARELDRVTRDLVDRGHDGKDRKLVLTLTFTPIKKKPGRVEIDAKVDARLPSHQPYATEAVIDQQGGGLLFHDESAANPDQTVISDHFNDEDDK